MHRGHLSVIGAALVIAVSAIGSAGAVPARVDLSTASGAAAYLRSIGIDARGIVVQREARNYAGPASQANGAVPPEQVEQMRGTCQTSGNCGLSQETSQNGVEFTNTLSGSSITSVVFCHNGDCTTAPTGATVRSFAARREAGHVALTWRTASEGRIAGFNVWRTGGGAAVRVNARLVPAKVAGRSLGAVYRVIDRRVRAGGPYRYRLQAVGLDGTRSWVAAAGIRRAF